MVGGKIVDFFIREKLPDFNYDVKFLVNDKSNSSDDYCCVCAEIPMAVMPELKMGDPIWWQNPNVYLCVFGSGDVPFKKIGFSGGGVKSFYEAKGKSKIMVL